MKKFLSYIFILITIVGLFSIAPTADAAGACVIARGPNQGNQVALDEASCKSPSSQAAGYTWDPNATQGTSVLGTCVRTGPAVVDGKPVVTTQQNVKREDCTKALPGNQGNAGAFTPYSSTNFVPGDPNAPKTDEGSGVQSELMKSCGTIINASFDGCLLRVFYFFFGTIPSWLMTVTASFLNVVIPMTISSTFYTNSAFVSDAWVVVRDISNIFFIIALLYVALQTILGLSGGHHGPKQMIGQIIIMALLINFSMFFTKVVIDGTNILALVFYNKVNIETKIVDGAKVPAGGYIPVLNASKTGVQDKDIAGAVMSGFDPSRLLSEKFFEKAREKTTGLGVGATATWTIGGAYLGTFIPVPILGTAIGATGGYVASKIVGWMLPSGKEVPLPLMIGIILTSGVIMYFAAYAFFIAGFSLIARMIELWLLIIFSPFAFMSSTIPKLGHIEGIGWDSWLKRLLSSAVFAPVYMFFIYLIFKLVQANIFKDMSDRTFENQGTLEAIILVIIPAAVIITMLKQATSYAKKGGGQIGEMLLGGAKALGALALGGTALGVAAVGRGVVGRQLAQASQTDKAKHYGGALFEYNKKLDEWDKKKGAKGPRPTFASGAKEYVDKTGKTAREKADMYSQIRRAGIADRIGGRINASQLRVGEIGHARQEKEALKKELHLDGVSDKNLSGAQLRDIEAQFGKKNRPDIERFVTRGYDAKNKKVKVYEYDANGKVVAGSGDNITRDEFMQKNRSTMAAQMVADTKAGKAGTDKADVNAAGTGLTPQGTLKLTNKLNKEYTDRVLRPNTERILGEKYHEVEHEAATNPGLSSNILARTTGGSYDLRNLAFGADKNAGLGAKATLGLIAAVAAGIRTGIKSTGIDTGKPKRDFVLDLKDTIGTALKNVNLSVKTSGGGHGGGDHGHGGGHGDDHGAAAGHH